MKKRQWKRRGWKNTAAGKVLEKPSLPRFEVTVSCVLKKFAESMAGLAKVVEQLIQKLSESLNCFLK